MIQRLQQKLRTAKAAVAQRDESNRHMADTLKQRDEELSKAKLAVRLGLNAPVSVSL